MLPNLRVVASSAWVKCWNRRATCSRVMPMPSSRTACATKAALRVVVAQWKAIFEVLEGLLFSPLLKFVRASGLFQLGKRASSFISTVRRRSPNSIPPATPCSCPRRLVGRPPHALHGFTRVEHRRLAERLLGALSPPTAVRPLSASSGHSSCCLELDDQNADENLASAIVHKSLVALGFQTPYRNRKVHSFGEREAARA